MRIAYCIITHKNTPILKECINILSTENDVYIHVDKKINIKEFEEYKNRAKFLTKRVDVRWGGYSQVEATLNLLEATNCKAYDYIFLLSGDCLPVKSNREIKEFLNKNNGKQFIAHDIFYKKTDERVKYIYPNFYFNKDKSIKDKVKIKIYNKFRFINKNKLYSKLPVLYKGTQWFGITGELKEYIFEYIKNNGWYIDAFRNSFCSDEVFFHSIVFNSKYKESIYEPKDKSNICFQALRYIDWKSGPEYPKLLLEEDYDKIKKSECLFARKFDSKIDIEQYRKKFIQE